MSFNNHKKITFNEFRLLSFLMLFSLIIRVPFIFNIGDLNLDNEWRMILDNYVNYGKFSFRKFEDFFVPNLTMPPLYPMYLYLIKKLFVFLSDEAYIQVVLFSQALLSSISVIIFFYLNKYFFSTKSSFISSLIFSVLPLHVFANSQISSVTLQLFLTLLSIYLLFKLIKKYSFKFLCFFSVVNGLLILIRGEFIIIFLFNLFYLNFFIEYNLKKILLIVCLTLLTISPYLVRNIIFLDELTITKSIGYNLWKGNNPKATVEGYPYEDAYSENLKKNIQNLSRDKYYDISYDNVFLQEAIYNILADPKKYISLALKKFLSFMIIDIKSTYPNYFSPIHYVPLLIISVLSIIGISTYRFQSRELNYLLFYLLLTVMIYSFFFILPRYKLAIIPMQIIFTIFVFNFFKNTFYKNNEKKF